MASPIARRLRRNQTEAEQRLWARLRRRQFDGYKFRRQVPLGAFIVDFACLSKKLIIEVDGGQHAERTNEDNRRSSWLVSQGYDILRFWNNDVLSNTDGVLEKIRDTLNHRD